MRKSAKLGLLVMLLRSFVTACKNTRERNPNRASSPEMQQESSAEEQEKAAPLKNGPGKTAPGEATPGEAPAIPQDSTTTSD